MRSPSPSLTTAETNLSPNSNQQITLDSIDSIDQETLNFASESLKVKLSQISYFQGFNELQIRSLIEMGFRQYLEEGEVVAQQGQAFRSFCIILSGKIDVHLQLARQERYIRSFETGEYFGELPLMLNLPSPGVLRAATESTLFVINEANFKKLLNDYPALAEDVANELSQRTEGIKKAYPEIWAEMHVQGKTDNSPALWIKQRLKDLFAPHSS